MNFIISKYFFYPKTNNASLSFSNKIKYFFKAYLATFALCFSVMLVIEIIDNIMKKYLGYSIKSRNVVNYKYKTNGILKNVIIVCILTPLFEEAIFRLWMNLKSINIVISTTIICVRFIYIKVGLLNIDHWQIILERIGAFIVIFFIFYFFLLKEKMMAISVSTKHFIFYFSAFVFGLVHILNYRPFDQRILFIYPIYIFPQIIMGLSLGNMRLKQGYWSGVLLHALINLPAAIFFLSANSA